MVGAHEGAKHANLTRCACVIRAIARGRNGVHEGKEPFPV